MKPSTSRLILSTSSHTDDPCRNAMSYPCHHYNGRSEWKEAAENGQLAVRIIHGIGHDNDGKNDGQGYRQRETLCILGMSSFTALPIAAYREE